MNLYIETDENGQTKNHPAFENNLIQAFGQIPAHWEPFVRVTRPDALIYQVLNSNDPTYQKVNGVWTDVWDLRDMTAEEKVVKQQETKDEWASIPDRDNFTAWTFDETTCSYVPPTAKPTEPAPEGQLYRWQGSSNTWALAPNYPSDGKNYIWNFTTWKWNEIVIENNPE
jgi:hypothetical protein